MPAARMDLFNITSSLKLLWACLCDLNQARTGPTWLFRVTRGFVQFHPCTPLHLQSVFTEKYFCVRGAVKYARKLCNHSRLNARGARIPPVHNHQYTEKVPCTHA